MHNRWTNVLQRGLDPVTIGDILARIAARGRGRKRAVADDDGPEPNFEVPVGVFQDLEDLKVKISALEPRSGRRPRPCGCGP
ncbi:hypothetical protein [Streptomyces sp. 900105245]